MQVLLNALYDPSRLRHFKIIRLFRSRVPLHRKGSKMPWDSKRSCHNRATLTPFMWLDFHVVSVVNRLFYPGHILLTGTAYYWQYLQPFEVHVWVCFWIGSIHIPHPKEFSRRELWTERLQNLQGSVVRFWMRLWAKILLYLSLWDPPSITTPSCVTCM